MSGGACVRVNAEAAPFNPNTSAYSALRNDARSVFHVNNIQRWFATGPGKLAWDHPGARVSSLLLYY